MTPELLVAVAEFAWQVTPETTERLASTLERISAPEAEPPGRVTEAFFDPAVRHQVRSLIACWAEDGETSAAALAAALLGAAAVREHDASERLELVWTGPLPAGASHRRTDEALLQVVREADQRLTLVTFAAYRVPSVAAELGRALGRGVEVRFVGETVEGADGRLSHDAAQALGSQLANRVHVFEWVLDRRPVDARGRRGALHAKCAVADEALLFISSANLTEAALDANMEMGLLVRGGPQPAAAARHFDRLIAEGVLRRVAR